MHGSTYKSADTVANSNERMLDDDYEAYQIHNVYICMKKMKYIGRIMSQHDGNAFRLLLFNWW